MDRCASSVDELRKQQLGFLVLCGSHILDGVTVLHRGQHLAGHHACVHRFLESHTSWPIIADSACAVMSSPGPSVECRGSSEASLHRRRVRTLVRSARRGTSEISTWVTGPGVNDARANVVCCFCMLHTDGLGCCWSDDPSRLDSQQMQPFTLLCPDFHIPISLN